MELILVVESVTEQEIVFSNSDVKNKYKVSHFLIFDFFVSFLFLQHQYNCMK